MISSIISRLVILVFGTLHPAYASYKVVRTKNAEEYVKWMMYWIVFALFTCAETFTDVFLNWFPFYYEIKIILVIWLLSPATKGSGILYRKFVHPALSSREQEIDQYISKAKEQSFKQVLDLGAKVVNVLMQTATIKNLSNILTSIVPYILDSFISTIRDEVNYITMSQSARIIAYEDVEFSNDDSEMEHYENISPKKPAKSSKVKNRIGTRKSGRRLTKTD